MTSEILADLLASSQQPLEKLNLSANAIHGIESDAFASLGTYIVKVWPTCNLTSWLVSLLPGR